MRAVIQRVNHAAVSVDGQVVGAIDRPGLLVLVGATHDDGAAQVALIARKIADLRLLEGELSVTDAAAPVLVVSQFTLYADTRKGRRPSWNQAAGADVAEPLAPLHTVALMMALMMGLRPASRLIGRLRSP